MDNQFSLNQKLDRFKREQENRHNVLIRALSQLNVLAPAPPAAGQAQAAAVQAPNGFVVQAIQNILADQEEEPAPVIEPFTFDPPARSVTEVMQLPQFRGNNARDRIMKFGPNTTYANVAEVGAAEQEWIVVALDTVDVSEFKHETECVVCVDQRNSLIDWERTLKKLKKLVKIRNYSGDSITRAINRLAAKFAPTMKGSLEGKNYNECADFLISTQAGMNRKAFKQKAVLSVCRNPQEPLIVPLTKIEIMLEELYPTRPPGGEIENPDDPVNQQRRVIHTGNVSTKNRQLIKGLISFVPDIIAQQVSETMQQDFNEGREPNYEELKRRVVEHEQNHNYVNTHELQYGRKINFKREPNVDALLNYNDLEEEAIALRSKRRRRDNTDDYHEAYGPNHDEDNNPNPQNPQDPNNRNLDNLEDDNEQEDDPENEGVLAGHEGLEAERQIAHVHYSQDEHVDVSTEYLQVTQELAEVNQNQGYTKSNGYMQTAYPGLPPPTRGRGQSNRSRGSFRGQNRGRQSNRGGYQSTTQRSDQNKPQGNRSNTSQNRSNTSQNSQGSTSKNTTSQSSQGNNSKGAVPKRDHSSDRNPEKSAKESAAAILREFFPLLVRQLKESRSRSTTPNGSKNGSKNTSRSNSYERYQNKKKQNPNDKEKREKRDTSKEKQKTTSYPARINNTEVNEEKSTLSQEQRDILNLFATSIQNIQ